MKGFVALGIWTSEYGEENDQVLAFEATEEAAYEAARNICRENGTEEHEDEDGSGFCITVEAADEVVGDRFGYHDDDIIFSEGTSGRCRMYVKPGAKPAGTDE